MRMPWEVFHPLRVEAALNDPSQAPAWQDVSTAARGNGARISRGNSRRRDNLRPGTCQLTMANDDGTFSGSLYRKPFRVAYRHPLPGNIVDAESASFEGGTVGAWTAGGSVPPALSNSTTRAYVGSKSMLITWGTGGFLPLANLTLAEKFVIGRRYKATMRVYVPSGHPNVLLARSGGGFGPTVTAKDAWTEATITFVATATTQGIQMWPSGGATAGQQCWVDAVMVDEADVPAEVVTRTNLATNPRAADASGFFNNNAYWTTTRPSSVPAGHPEGVTTGAQIVVTNAASAGPTLMSLYSLDNLMNSVVVRGIGAWVWVPYAANANMYLSTTGVPSAKMTPVQANTWTFVTSGTAGTGYAILSVSRTSGNVTNGDTSYVTGVVALDSAVPSSFFDGDTPNTNLFHRWTGPPGASTSEEYTPGLGPFTTSPLPVSYRFTGRAMTNDTEFPALGHSDAPLVLADELAWLGQDFRPFIDVPGQEILSRGPLSLFRLNGDLGDQVPGGKPLAPAGNGAAPTESSAVMSSASSAVGTAFSGGQRLEGSLTSAAGSFFSTGLTVTALVRTTSTGTVLAIGDKYGDTLTLAITAGGVTATTTNQFNAAVNMTTATSSPVNDGQPHVITARWRNDDTLSVHVDTAAPVSTTLAGGWSAHRRANVTVAVGGNRYGATFTGSIANVAAFDQPLSDAVIAEFGSAVLTGFLGESAQDRLARYNRWAGSPFAVIDATGAAAQVGHYDCDGKAFTDCVDAVATVEDGIAYVRGDGALALRSRASFINPAVAFSVPGPAAGDANRMRDTLKLTSDPTRAVNDVTGNRPGGGSQRVINSASQATYGRRTASIEGPFPTDESLASVLEWIVNTESTPTPEPEGISVRLSQLDDAQTLALLAADLGATIAWTGLPTQAGATSSGTAAICGLEETYSNSDLLWTPQVQPNAGVDVWVIEDPTFGALDSTHRIAY